MYGLTSQDAAKLLKQYGYNEGPRDKHDQTLRLLLKILTEPMFFLLIACATIYFFLGEKTEATALLISVIFVVGITFYQENKTEKTLKALKNLASPRALVFRDGKPTQIPGRDVVPQDVLILNEGDRVPADAVIISATNLSLNESLLTGEADVVQKNTAGDKIFSGSAIGFKRGNNLVCPVVNKFNVCFKQLLG